jgi:hypothetical protein
VPIGGGAQRPGDSDLSIASINCTPGATDGGGIGQKEDPDFTFRVMVVQVQWPGATVEEMQEQVVDKIERKLQEVPGLGDPLRAATLAGMMAFVSGMVCILAGIARLGFVTELLSKPIRYG